MTTTTKKYYAGIGSRDTPERMCVFMTQIACWMEQRGWTLRSGGAERADSAFELGIVHDEDKQIFLPWSGFNANRSPLFISPKEAFDTVDVFHPTPHRLSQAARKMMARNACQVLGPDLKTPSKMVICWTPGGQGEGGTGQAIRIAKHYGIEVHDLGLSSQLQHIEKVTGLTH